MVYFQRRLCQEKKYEIQSNMCLQLEMLLNEICKIKRRRNNVMRIELEPELDAPIPGHVTNT